MIIFDHRSEQCLGDSKKYHKSQGMVEFALAIPILLLIILGLFDTGRLIFLYGTIAAASREAVRYGSATGLNTSGGIPLYKDCNGIRAAAQRIDFLNVIDDNNIIISYDEGPGQASFSGCPPTKIMNNGYRIKVQVRASFAPVAGLVPLKPITLTSYSARSLLIKVEIIK
jgi:Flp pilus assembly protein TadG